MQFVYYKLNNVMRRCGWMGRHCMRRMFALRCCITACIWPCPGAHLGQAHHLGGTHFSGQDDKACAQHL